MVTMTSLLGLWWRWLNCFINTNNEVMNDISPLIPFPLLSIFLFSFTSQYSFFFVKRKKKLLCALSVLCFGFCYSADVPASWAYGTHWSIWKTSTYMSTNKYFKGKTKEEHCSFDVVRIVFLLVENAVSFSWVFLLCDISLLIICILMKNLLHFF